MQTMQPMTAIIKFITATPWMIISFPYLMLPVPAYKPVSWITFRLLSLKRSHGHSLWLLLSVFSLFFFLLVPVLPDHAETQHQYTKSSEYHHRPPELTCLGKATGFRRCRRRGNFFLTNTERL